MIKKNKLVVSRELKRNCDKRSGECKYDLGQFKYDQRKKDKSKKEVFTQELKAQAKDLLEQDYSLEQISGKIKLAGQEMVSHKTIYRWIWSNKRQKGKRLGFLAPNEKF